MWCDELEVKPMRQVKWILAAAACLGLAPGVPARDERGAGDKGAPTMVTLRVRASDRGRPESLSLLGGPKEQRLEKTTGVLDMLGPGCPGWKAAFQQALTEELGELRTKLKLPRSGVLQVAPDPQVRFEHLGTILQAAKEAGFPKVEFVVAGADEVRLRIDKSGAITLNDKPLAVKDIKERLTTDARAVGADKLKVVIEADAGTEFTVVFSLLQLVQDAGCTNVRLRSSPESARP
jgi:biopolymer transport protein ExbD